MSGGRFNTIVILDCIPEGDLNTARRLKESLEDLACYYDEAKDLIVKYFRIEDINDLKEALVSIQSEVETGGMLPWFHLEGHGLDDWSGFEMANRSDCSWLELKKFLTPINIASDFNVVLVLATCFGGSFATVIETTDRAPVLALVGPTKEAITDEIEKAFPEFYEKLMKFRSFEDALSALDARTTSGHYYRTSATNFFYEVWSNYKIQLCTPEELHKRAKKIQKDVKSQGVARVPGLGSIKRQHAANDQRLFDEYRDKYFMYDLNHENRNRFQVTYKEAEAIADKIRKKYKK